MRSGKISVKTENIFPIIKKFLYSEQEIFLRELISNAVDATTKLKVLSSKGEAKGELGELKIEISIHKENGTLSIKDRGIGMDEEEVKNYLNQVAFSSAEDFINKYKGEANIIGHFGLGFYSAFMVSDKVEVITKSYKENAVPVKWTCLGDTEFNIEEVIKEDRGTEIILYLTEDCKEYLEDARIEGLLDKFCKFLPVPIQFGTRKEKIKEGEVETEIEKENIINNPNPLWKKAPTDITDEEYKNFYNELYPYSEEPLFWIHLNIDYPFNLTGILYFPKIKQNIEIQKNKIHLYSNQVFVTDDVKEIVPEFLMLLHGVIDSPDIPLNVSRSYLQADAHVRKISGYITRKVAEKLHDLFKKDRADFEKKWSDISTFIKYGLISDEKFAEKTIPVVLFENTEKKFFTIDEYKEHIKQLQTDKNNRLTVLYTNDPKLHYRYIAAAKEQGYDVLLMNNVLDNHFIQQMEMKAELTFKRVDSDTLDKLIEKEEKTESVLSEADQKTVEEIFKSISINKGSNTLLKALSPNDPPVMIVKPEFMRRMSEMQYMMHAVKGEADDHPFLNHYESIINSNHPIVATKLLAEKDSEKRKDIADYLFKLAMLDQQMLQGEALHDFVKKSLESMH
ncbi:MAG: molecular chaperone HtpG [Saprospiraceae bacterium]|nr:molecular chaperone HtpG [Saprospiraceae bacterium]MBK9726786.1 molecular chaperone HtpG [Saprospiraceae bacterium]